MSLLHGDIHDRIPRLGPNRGVEHSSPAFERQAAETLTTLQQLAEVGVWTYDVGEEELWWSKEARRIHGLDTAPIPDVIEQYAETDQRKVFERLSEAVERGESFSVDVGYASERTTERTMRFRCAPIMEDGQTVMLQRDCPGRNRPETTRTAHRDPSADESRPQEC